MSIPRESDSASPLYCELCDYVQFSSYTEFHVHHLSHVRQPLVALFKINPNLNAKLLLKSYKVNTGVARRSNNIEHVPPLKISVVKQQGLKHFQVITKSNNSGNHSSKIDSSLDTDPGNSGREFDSRPFPAKSSGPLEVEGKNLLERFGANISVSRKGKFSARTLEKTGNTNENIKKETEDSHAGLEVQTDNFLERVNGIDGISVSTAHNSSTNGTPESKAPSDISIPSKQKSVDVKQLKKLMNQSDENEKYKFNRNKCIEKLSDSGPVTDAPKTSHTLEEVKSKELAGYDKIGNVKTKAIKVLERLGRNLAATSVILKSENNNDCLELKKSGDFQTCQVKSNNDDSFKVLNDNSSENYEQKRFVRVKNSNFSKKNSLSEKQNSLEDRHPEERIGTPEESTESESAPRETGIDILERLTQNLNNTVGGNKSAVVEKPEESISKAMEEPLLTANLSGGDQNPELTASETKCSSSGSTSNVESETRINNGTNSQDEEQQQPCTLLLTPPNSSGQQEGDNSNFSSIGSQQNGSFVDSSNVSEQNNEVNENAVGFTSLTSEDQSQEQGDPQNSFWSDGRSVSNAVDQSQQDPLMTPENTVPNGDTINPTFLHNFLNEPPPANSIPPENSEFMSLDRLAQSQHQPTPYDLNSGGGSSGAGDSNTPMEQLSQQVQRMPNPTPQINVISQHHMQAPQPPQLHTGVPLQPQHISPQAPSSYDALSHMQPPMPPPLYQGYNMYSQNYSPQTPQQMPRPPMLQKRPQIQARPFQSLAAPPRQRTRGAKRNVLRLSPSHDMTPPKQSRRLDLPLQVRPQIQNSATAKLPSGITVTPPKNAVEANKVANVLASRGITVTPAVSRQTNQGSSRPQQQRTTGQSPILNIGSGVSITSSSQNRNAGGFAVPGPRRNVPIVNHHVERPERCTTVDLTQDDEPPQMSRRLGKFPCKQCGKTFTSPVALESHKACHRAAAALPYKCDKCSAQYTTLAHLQQHKVNFHKAKQPAPDLAIPIVDLNHPGAREQLAKCGVYNFIPLAQLQSNNNGYFGIPIIQLDTAKEKAVSSLSTLGVGNIFILGKMKALAPAQPNQ